jgi:hypothetical protein
VAVDDCSERLARAAWGLVFAARRDQECLLRNAERASKGDLEMGNRR